MPRKGSDAGLFSRMTPAEDETRCGGCGGVGVVFDVVGCDADGCPVRDATGCDVCGGSGYVVP